MFVYIIYHIYIIVYNLTSIYVMAMRSVSFVPSGIVKEVVRSVRSHLFCNILAKTKQFHIAWYPDVLQLFMKIIERTSRLQHVH